MEASQEKSMSTTSNDHQVLGKRDSRASGKRLLHSDSSISYQMGARNPTPTPSSPSYLHQESLKESLTDNVDIDPESKSILLGAILVTIMLTSLISFVTSKVRRCSHHTDVAGYENCSRYFHLYSIASIGSCSVSFIIYFLHLISQCDIMCLGTHRVEYELVTVSLTATLLGVATGLYFSQPGALVESFSLASFILTDVALFLYFIRTLMLCRALVVNRKKRTIWQRQLSTLSQSNAQAVQRFSSRRSISRDSSHVVTMPSPSAVRNLMIARQISLSSALAAHKQKQQLHKQHSLTVGFVRNGSRKQTLSTSVSDDFDDDVFIQ